VAEHLVPGSENLKKQSKLLESLGKDVVLDKTGLTGFLNLLTQKLVANSKEKLPIRISIKHGKQWKMLP
jgi:hypothetical protein